MSHRNSTGVVYSVGVVLRAGAALAAVAVAMAPAAAEGAVVIASQSAEVDQARNRGSFVLEFNAEPDFYTLDEFGRVKDSFQYEIDGDGPVPGEIPVEDVEAVVRGDEIHATDALRVRAAGPGVEPDPDPLSGGWGPVRTTVPFDLDGTRLTFDVPLDALGDAATDGVFSYRVFTVEYGSMNSIEYASVGAAPNPIPLPAGLLTGGATGAGLLVLRALRRSKWAR